MSSSSVMGSVRVPERTLTEEALDWCRAQAHTRQSQEDLGKLV